MIYLDNAATSFPKAPGVAEATATFIREAAANPGRAGHRMATAAERMLDDLRLKLARLFNAPSHERIVFTLNGTDALNIAIHGVLTGPIEAAAMQALGEGGRPHVVTTVLEHNSVSRPLQTLADAGRITLTRVDCDDTGLVDPAAIGSAMTPQTKLVVLTHASNVTGTIQDAAAVGAVVREARGGEGRGEGRCSCSMRRRRRGCFQSMCRRCRWTCWRCRGTSHCWARRGPGCCTSVHAAACRSTPTMPGQLPGPGAGGGDSRGGGGMRPFRIGGTGGDSATPVQPTLMPYFLEGGTPNTVGLAGLAAGLDHVLATPLAEVLAHEQQLCAQLIDALAQHPETRLLGSPDPASRVGTVSFTVEGFDASDLGSILDDSFDIAVRPGLHCSPYAHRRFGTFPDGAVRVSRGRFRRRMRWGGLWRRSRRFWGDLGEWG